MAEEKEDRKRYREFLVTPGVRGFCVGIGCSLLFFDNADDLAHTITKYLKDPTTTERELWENDHRMKTLQPAGLSAALGGLLNRTQALEGAVEGPVGSKVSA